MTKSCLKLTLGGYKNFAKVLHIWNFIKNVPCMLSLQFSEFFWILWKLWVRFRVLRLQVVCCHCNIFFNFQWCTGYKILKFDQKSISFVKRSRVNPMAYLCSALISCSVNSQENIHVKCNFSKATGSRPRASYPAIKKSLLFYIFPSCLTINGVCFLLVSFKTWSFHSILGLTNKA